MGAQPKNKITRVERGKRRAGNTKQVTKDPNTTQAPLHKRGFMAQIKQSIGMNNGQTTASSK